MMLTKLVLAIIIFVNLSYCIEQPPYQVLIWLRSISNNTSAKQICSGAIIHEDVILTVADCMLNSTGKPGEIYSSSGIYITAGNGPNAVKINISKIELNRKFRLSVLENDVAILILNKSLDLSTRNDIKWIMLDDHYDYRKCQIQIYNDMISKRSSAIQSYDVPILKNRNCTNTTSFQSPRSNDICSFYILDSELCKKKDENIDVANDAGTALICDSKFIGLLSQTVPGSRKNCTINAIYTKVSMHLDWIYEKMAIEDTKYLGKTNHEMGTPYDASAPATTISKPNDKDPIGNEVPGIDTKGTTLQPHQSILTPNTSHQSTANSTNKGNNAIKITGSTLISLLGSTLILLLEI